MIKRWEAEEQRQGYRWVCSLRCRARIRSTKLHDEGAGL